jgi:hypothetical protein
VLVRVLIEVGAIDKLVGGWKGVRFFEVLSTVASEGFRVIHAMVVASCGGCVGEGWGGCIDVPLELCCGGEKEKVAGFGGEI